MKINRAWFLVTLKRGGAGVINGDKKSFKIVFIGVFVICNIDFTFMHGCILLL